MKIVIWKQRASEEIDIIQHFSKRVNPFRDAWRHYHLSEAADILSGIHLLEYSTLERVTKETKVFSNDEERIYLMH